MMEMLEFEPNTPTSFFILEKDTGKQYDTRKPQLDKSTSDLTL